MRPILPCWLAAGFLVGFAAGCASKASHSYDSPQLGTSPQVRVNGAQVVGEPAPMSRGPAQDPALAQAGAQDWSNY